MKLVLGRTFGLVGIAALAPAIGLVGATLKLLVGSNILREEDWLLGGRRVRTRCFVTPPDGFGSFLRGACLHRLPLLFDIAAGRVSMVVSYDAADGLAWAASVDRTQLGSLR